MSQEIVTNYFDMGHDKKIREYTKNTTFVLITCVVGEGEIITKKLAMLKPVKEIWQTVGQYDIIIKFEGANETELDELIQNDIRSMKAVRSIMTLKPVSLA